MLGFAGNSIGSSDSGSSSFDWEQYGPKGVNASDYDQQASLIAEFNAGAVSATAQQLLTALYNDPNLGQPLAPQNAPNYRVPDLGNALGVVFSALGSAAGNIFSGIGNLVGGLFSNGPVGQVIVGAPYVVPMAANPFASNNTQSQPEPVQESAADREYWADMAKIDALNDHAMSQTERNQAIFQASISRFQNMSLQLGAKIGDAAPIVAVAPLAVLSAAPMVITEAGALISTESGKWVITGGLAAANFFQSGGPGVGDEIENLADETVGAARGAIVAGAGAASDVYDKIKEQLQ